jgi:hypothetical protein
METSPWLQALSDCRTAFPGRPDAEVLLVPRVDSPADDSRSGRDGLESPFDFPVGDFSEVAASARPARESFDHQSARSSGNEPGRANGPVQRSGSPIFERDRRAAHESDELIRRGCRLKPGQRQPARTESGPVLDDHKPGVEPHDSSDQGPAMLGLRTSAIGGLPISVRPRTPVLKFHPSFFHQPNELVDCRIGLERRLRKPVNQTDAGFLTRLQNRNSVVYPNHAAALIMAPGSLRLTILRVHLPAVTTDQIRNLPLGLRKFDQIASEFGRRKSSHRQPGNSNRKDQDRGHEPRGPDSDRLKNEPDRKR